MLTKDNQGYHDRLQRARSWLDRIADIPIVSRDQRDYEGAFICYWIALNALYAQRKNERKEDELESAWLVRMLCKLDRYGKIRDTISGVKQQADALIHKKYLYSLYWSEGTTAEVLRNLGKDGQKAREAWRDEDIGRYLEILFRRLHVLRNQIFHGCSTDHRSLNRGSLRPAVEVLEALVPALVEVMESFGKSTAWPRIEFPRDGSPQNPDYLRRGRKQ